MRASDEVQADYAADLQAVDVDAVRKSIQDLGYCIARNVVAPDIVFKMRDHWLREYSSEIAEAPVIWGPFLGERNRLLYHRSESCCFYRSYDFLWNSPMHALSRSVGVGLNRIRNEIVECGRLAGETLESDRYAVYITTTYYPPDEGWLEGHEDRTDDRRHWHFMLLLTFKGESFDDGGLYLVDRAGERVDIDARVEPGDVIFFDGALRHGVDAVSGGDGGGRLQLFSIPTFMEDPARNDRLLDDVSVRRFVKAKLRPWKHRIFGRPGQGGPYA